MNSREMRPSWWNEEYFGSKEESDEKDENDWMTFVNKIVAGTFEATSKPAMGYSLIDSEQELGNM